MSTRVSTDAASMVVWIEDRPGLFGLYSSVPLTLVKAPRTVEIPRCLTENCAEECCGSIFQESWAAAARVKSRKIALTSTDSLRFLNRNSPGMNWDGTSTV